MTLGEYLVSRIIYICIIGISAILIMIFLLLLQCSTALVISSELLIFIVSLLWIFISFFHQRNKIKKLNNIIDGLDEKYLIGDVLPRPKDAMESYYYEALRTVSRSAVDAVYEAERQRNEYRSYVENWIHEMKTPLTACSLILENGSELSRLRSELKRADNLTECILYYARAGRPEKDTVIRKFNIRDVIDDAIKEQMSILIASKIKCIVYGGFQVYSDDKAVKFILCQLLINSAKYCQGCTITINADDGCIIYEDNGIGIPSHEIKRVTERGYTGTNGRMYGSSTGMGLYIASELCSHLNISLTIESEVKKYTRFHLSFNSLTKM